MTSFSRVAAITGANRGLGYAIVRQIALAYPRSKLALDRHDRGRGGFGPLLLFLCSRTHEKAADAVAGLHVDEELRANGVLLEQGGAVEIRPAVLDVSRSGGDGGIDSFVQGLLRDCKVHAQGGLDVLINNAGIVVEGKSDSQAARETLQTNYYGAVALTQRLLPHMASGGRVVNMASRLGKLTGKYPPSLSQSFKAAAADSTSIEPVNSLMRAFQKSVDANAAVDQGWPTSPYVISKTGLIAATMSMGRREREKMANGAEGGGGVLINCCCPGFVKTELTNWRGRKGPDAGAATPVKLALGDIGGVGGEFWENEQVSSW